MKARWVLWRGEVCLVCAVLARTLVEGGQARYATLEEIEADTRRLRVLTDGTVTAETPD